jgi:hypothetical protein
MQKTNKHQEDIAISLQDLKKKDLNSLMPQRDQSEETDAVMKNKEQSDMDIRYQAELERYLEWKDTLEQNLNKAYALIFSTSILQQDDAESDWRTSWLGDHDPWSSHRAAAEQDQGANAIPDKGKIPFRIADWSYDQNSEYQANWNWRTVGLRQMIQTVSWHHKVPCGDWHTR